MKKHYYHKNYILVLLFGLFFISNSFAVPDEYRSLVDKIKKFELGNGLTILTAERNHAPVFTGQIWVKVGGVDEEWGKSGSAHLLEHMAFKGTEEIGTKDFAKEKILLKQQEELILELRDSEDSNKRKKLEETNKELENIWEAGEFTKLLEQHGAKGLNAATSADYTMYTMSLPKDQLEFWFYMESERLRRPVFRQFYKELNVVLEERRMRTEDNPTGKLYEALLASAFWNHPYQQPTIGWKKDLLKLVKKDAEELHKKFYQPGNMVLVVVGDVVSEKVQEYAERYFGNIKNDTSYLSRKAVHSNIQEGERIVKVSYPSEQEFMMAYHKPSYPDPDSAHLSMLYSILDEGRSSPFQKTLVQELKLMTSIYTTEAPGERYSQVFIIGGTPAKGHSIEESIKEIEKILANLEITPEILDAAKKRLKFQILSSLSSNSGLSSFIGKRELLYNDWKDFFKELDQIEKTKAEDIKAAISKYLIKTNRTLALVENK